MIDLIKLMAVAERQLVELQEAGFEFQIRMKPEKAVAVVCGLHLALKDGQFPEKTKETIRQFIQDVSEALPQDCDGARLMFNLHCGFEAEAGGKTE